MDMFITVTRMQNMDIFSLPWPILKACHWQQVETVLIQIKQKRMTMQVIYGQKLPNILITHSEYAFLIATDMLFGKIRIKTSVLTVMLQ